MGANLSTKDIYALELFASTEYFQELRDAFALCLKAAEDALEIFMRHLPPDYRSRHVSLQPDAVWGELVLPNMRWTLQELNQGYIQVSHGNLDGLQTSGNVRTNFASISREFVWDWMNSKNQLEFEEQWTIASRAAANISRTTLGNWLNGAHSGLVPKDEQDNWPIYRLNDSVQVRTNDEVTVSGVYVSDSVGSCAQFLIAGYEAWQAAIPDPPLDPNVTSSARKLFDATWTLVERVSDSGGDPSGFEPALSRMRCEAGQPCPKTGYWLTPALANSRRHFEQGDVMPALGGDYGVTIWQWDAIQD